MQNVFQHGLSFHFPLHAMNDRERRFFFRAGGAFHLYLDTEYKGFSESHSHTFYQLLLLNRGHISLMQGGTKYHQLPDDLFFTPPNCEHSLFFFGSEISYYCLSYTEEFARSIFSQYPKVKPDFSNFPPLLHLDAQTVRIIRAAFDAALMGASITGGTSGKPCAYFTAAAIAAALATATEYIAAHEHNTEEFTAETAVHEAVHYIDIHFFEDITVEKIAARTKLSKSCFCKKFLELTGISPKRYITDKRMHEALNLIYQGTLSLGRIAEDVGYKDFSTFYRSFHQITGISPSEYKASLHKSEAGASERRFNP